MAVSTKGASCSRDGLSLETLQLLRLRCVKALTELGAQGVPQVVELFSFYDLGKPVRNALGACYVTIVTN